MSQVRIFYTSDIHGSDKCFRKFMAAGNFYKCKILILGGDITGKMLISLVEQSDGTFRVDWPVERTLKSAVELSQFEDAVRTSGHYFHVISHDQLEKLSADKTQYERLFTRLQIERLSEWMNMGEKYLRTQKDTQCFIMPGNDDTYEIDKILEGHEPIIINPDEKVIPLSQEYELASLGCSNITPWNCPRDIPEEEISKRIDRLESNVGRMETCIFNFHCPPYDTHLDVAPKLDKDLRPVRGQGGIATAHVGSTAVRNAILKYQPMLGLHGHIHESRAASTLGRTLCMNTGSEYSEGLLRGSVIVLENGKVKTHMFTTG